jgi:tRNA A37 threonylcarbamoyladenosine dehydratase
MQAFSRVKLLIGADKLEKLKNSHVAVFGVGGVGGVCAESLVRSGIGEITVIDNDEVSISNLNRQIISTVDTVGMKKTQVIKDRLLSINPNLKFNAFNLFYLPENSEEIDFSKFDYVVDAVDTVTAKLLIIKNAKMKGVPVISCMGTGGKMQIDKLAVADIEKTSVCPLARVMRRELKKLNISGV